jgi:hypothetical protein
LYLQKNDIKYHYIEPKVLSNVIKNGSFLDADNTIYRQFHQFQQLIEQLLSGEIDPNETIFVSDIWNFSLLAIPYLNYFSKYHLKVRGILHAGSFTDTDFVRQLERYYKCFEDIIFDICEEIYVGSEFIKQDILRKRFVYPGKIKVTGLPLDYLGLDEYKRYRPKENLIVFNGRNVDEKQPHLFELLKERLPQYKYINTQEEGLSKDEYYAVLSKAKCVVSFALQENFGYGIQEAVYLGCVPVVPNRLSYIEQFRRFYRYDTFDDCIDLVLNAMNEDLKPTTNTFPSNDEIFKVWFKS